jgi:hypothetical protein
MMFRSLLSCLGVASSLVVAMSPAYAADKQLMLTNRSGEAITALVITATATPDQPLVITGALPANSATAMLTVSLPDGACIFDATYTFASGQTNKQPDLDICQLDGLVVE